MIKMCYLHRLFALQWTSNTNVAFYTVTSKSEREQIAGADEKTEQ